MDKTCALCENLVYIPKYLEENYKKIGVNVCTGHFCSITNEAKNPDDDICNDFYDFNMYSDYIYYTLE